MDFFARQDQARKNTRLLVCYFAVAVVLIVGCVYFASLFLFQGVSNARHRHRTTAAAFTLWNPQLLMYAAAGTLLIIGGGSAVRMAQLSGGGSAVAESMGGRLLNTNTRDPHERKLLNVVEEMAIASGVPVPQVYVLDDEEGINAFAAGHTINDAAIGVTRGCIVQLKRDELQGVIAHEFSHILNGDMRLNLRLMGIIFGIMCLAVIGRTLLRVRGSGRDKNPLPLFGIILLILGWVGVFFGQLIQAAVSRQREFLADASAVQFTRNPDGIGGALKKIGAAQHGSQIENEHAAEASHMFFGSALKSSWFNAFATHPPLAERIRAIDPYWDGKFVTPRQVLEEEAGPERAPQSRLPFPPIIPGFPAGAAGVAGLAAVPADAVLPTFGNPTSQHLRYAMEFRETLPPQLRDAAHEPAGAAAILLGLVLSTGETERHQQLEELRERIAPDIYAQLALLGPEVQSIAQTTRLPLVNLAIPALRQWSPAALQSFIQALNWLIASDEQIVLFEFMLQKIVHRQLEPFLARRAPAPVQYYSIKPLAADCEVLLSALAHTGQTEDQAAGTAFDRGVPLLRMADTLVTLRSWEQCSLNEIDGALNQLAQAAPQIKKNLLAACVQVVGADGVVQENEAELLRAIAEALDCPLPPILLAA